MKLLYFISSFYVVGNAFAQVKWQQQLFQSQSGYGYETPAEQNMRLAGNSNETDTESTFNQVIDKNSSERRKTNHFPDNRINLTYPTPTLFDHCLWNRQVIYQHLTNQTFNGGILGVGVNNFMSYAAHFCKNETQGGRIEIISIGCGDGSVDRKIIHTYRGLFGEELNITLVDSYSKYEVDFRTVDDLIQKRANVVENCSLLIIWPELMCGNDNYDIESIYKLRPQAVLTLYETAGNSGSSDFLMFWKTDHHYYCDMSPKMSSVLNLYNVEEVVYQEVHFEAGLALSAFTNVTYERRPNIKAFRLRMMKARRRKST